MADETIDLRAVRDAAAKARAATDVPAPPGRLDLLNEAAASITLIAATQAQMGSMVIRLQEDVAEQKSQIARLIEINRAICDFCSAQPEGYPDDDDD